MGALSGTLGATGTVNYASGAFSVTHTNGAVASTITFSYYPALPVLGLEDFDTLTDTFPKLVAFDQKYSYQFNQNTRLFYDTTFFKETGVAFTFKGSDFNQFYSVSYENNMFVVNEDPGLHGVTISNASLAGTTLTVTTSSNHGLSTADYVYINEIQGTTVTNINGTSGNISNVGANTFDITVATGS